MVILEFMQSFDFSASTWVIIILLSVIVGIGRSGIFGVMVIVVPVLSLFIGGKPSAGFVLPWMIMGDWISIFFYRKTIQWPVILRILPWIVLGILIGAWVGNLVSDQIFRGIMGGVTFLCLALLLWQERRGGVQIRYSIWIVALIGVLSGFGSMIGNIAGPIIAMYFFTLRLDKIGYVSSMVSLFWIVNMLKVPFHVFYWGTINAGSFKLNLILSPLILLGVFMGYKIIKKIPEKPFKVFILASIGAAGLTLMI